MRTRRRLVVLSLAMVFVASGATACASMAEQTTLDVLGPWTGAEETQFRRALDEFTKRTGTTVNYQGTRSVGDTLLADLQDDDPPDIAIFPSPGELAPHIQRDEVVALDDVVGDEWTAEYGVQWRRLAAAGRDELYAVPVQVGLKSLVWFNPRELTPPPAPRTWDDLIGLTRSLDDRAGVTPWCDGVRSTGTFGWPGTDWIEDILLKQSGVDAYERWARGELPWTSPQVREAWLVWGRIATGAGTGGAGIDPALLNEFTDAGRPLFAQPPGCFLHHQASFIMSVYRDYRDPRLSAGADFDFFPFPEFPGQSGPTRWEVSADLAALFRDSEDARELIRFMVSDEAQRFWPEAGAGAFSANAHVGRDAYLNDQGKRIADVLLGGDTLCFDASDQMPATMRNAFYRAVLRYLSDPSRLNDVLDDLEKIRTRLSDEPVLTVSCGQS